jgi:hypothetical protein
MKKRKEASRRACRTGRRGRSELLLRRREPETDRFLLSQLDAFLFLLPFFVYHFHFFNFPRTRNQAGGNARRAIEGALSHLFFRKNQVHNYMHAKIKFRAYSDK